MAKERENSYHKSWKMNSFCILDQSWTSLALKPPNLYFIRQSYRSPLDCFRKIPSRIKHLEFLGSLFYSWNSRRNKASPLEIRQNCVAPIGNSKAKMQDPWEFHIIFAWWPLGILAHHIFVSLVAIQSSRSNFLCYGIFLDIYGNLLLVCHSYQFMGL